MKQTLWGVLVLSVGGGILLQLFPKSSRIMPYVRFLLALVLLVMLLSPLISLLSELQIADITTLLPENVMLSDYDDFWASSVTDAAQARIQASLNTLICAEFGMDPEDICVDLTTETVHGDEETTVTVTAVTVTLRRRAHRIAADKIAALVERTMLCPCTVLRSEEEYA